MPSQRLAAVLLFASFATALMAQTSPALLPGSIDALAINALNAQNLPGVTLAVVQDGRIVYSSAFGFSDLENKVKASRESEIRTASIAKPMTAIAALELARAGKLDLDAPVQQYCPAFPAKTSPDGKPWVVTTRQLLAHRAGERWYRDDTEQKNAKHYSSIDEAVRHFGDDPLLFAPGDKMQYSSYGYVVVGCAIEGASQETFTDYMQQAVFKPADMTATVADNPLKIIDHRARGYQKSKDGVLENAPFFDPSDRLPGGGWLSTSDDLVRFAAAVMSGKLVPAATLEEMWKPLSTGDNGSGYGLGWGIGALNGHRVVGHNGGQVGASTSLKLLPERQIAVAVMTNLEGASLDQLAESVLKLYLPAQASETGSPH
jgi:CubicO group peptidase (beta-lactamase class C family)